MRDDGARVIVVLVSCELYGDTIATASAVTESGMLVEMPFAPPLGHVVTVWFHHPGTESVEWDGQLAIRAEVCHYAPVKRDDASRVIGMRFLSVVDDGMHAPDAAADRMH